MTQNTVSHCHLPAGSTGFPRWPANWPLNLIYFDRARFLFNNHDAERFFRLLPAFRMGRPEQQTVTINNKRKKKDKTHPYNAQQYKRYPYNEILSQAADLRFSHIILTATHAVSFSPSRCVIFFLNTSPTAVRKIQSLCCWSQLRQQRRSGWVWQGWGCCLLPFSPTDEVFPRCSMKRAAEVPSLPPVVARFSLVESPPRPGLKTVWGEGEPEERTDQSLGVRGGAASPGSLRGD